MQWEKQRRGAVGETTWSGVDNHVRKKLLKRMNEQRIGQDVTQENKQQTTRNEKSIYEIIFIEI